MSQTNPWELDWSQGGQPTPAPAPAPGGVRIGTPSAPDPYDDALDAERLRQLRISNARALEPDTPSAPSGYRFNSAGGLEPIPGGPADPNVNPRGRDGRAMRQADADRLERDVSTFGGLLGALNTFRPDYGGNPIGGLENWAQGMLPVGTEGQRDWWANFRAFDNQIRNDLFGATLTPSEQASYEATSITPSMRAEEIQANLRRRSELVRAALGRRTTRLIAGGFNENEVAAALGDYAPVIMGGQDTAQPTAPRNDTTAGVAIPAAGGQPPVGPVDPLGMGGPAVLPQARGAQGDAGIGAAGVADAAGGDGMRVVPGLYGLGGEISALIQRGATREQVLAHYQARMERAGVTPSFAQVQVINEVMQKHEQFPAAPVTALADGWDNFHMQPTTDTGGSLLGRVADSSIGAGIIGAANGISAGGLRAVAGDTGASVIDYAQNERPVATFIGDVAGTTGALLGGEALAGGLAARGGALAARGGMLGRAGGAVGRLAQMAGRGNGVILDTAYGAGRGAIEADPGQGVSGALLGGLAGAGGNALGQGVANIGGRVVRGVSDPAVNYLAQQGIRLTPGQILGRSTNPLARGLGRVENALESVPIVGNQIRGMREQSLGDFASTAVDQAVAPVGGGVPAGLPGAARVDAGNQVVSNAFDRALGPVNMMPDQPFIDSMRQAGTLGRGARTYGQDFTDILADEVAPIAGSGDTITGRQFQDLSRTLGGYGRRYNEMAVGTPTTPPAPAARPVGQAFDQMRGATDSLLQRTNSDAFAQYEAARQAYRQMRIIQDATDNARNGTGSGQTDVFTPAQLTTAAARNARRFGGTHGTTDQPFYELTRAGQDVLPSTVPNSGTADRALATMAIPAALGGGGYAMGLDPETAVMIATAGLPYTAGGRRLMQAGLVGGARRRRLGDALVRNQEFAGRLGAGLALPALFPSGQ